MSSGLTIAVLNSDGTSPGKRSVYDLCESGRRREMFSLSGDVGSRTSSQVFCAVFLRMLCTYMSDTGVN